jgi:hypothetical protein
MAKREIAVVDLEHEVQTFQWIPTKISPVYRSLQDR